MTATADTTATSRKPRGGLLRHADFRRLWTAETISQFGTQVSLLGIPLIAALTLNVTPFEFGLLGTIEFLPFILLSLPAGVWVDRLHRRPILIVGDLGRGLALLSIPVAVAFNALTIWQLYLVGFLNGCLTVFFDVSYQAYLPSLVDREEILEGNSKLEISRSAAQILGPGIAGQLIGLITAPIAILVDSISYVLSALFVFRIRKKEPAPAPHPDAVDGKGPGMRKEIAAGLHYVTGQVYLRAIAACTAISNFFSNVAFAILVLYLVRDLGLSPAALGLTFSIGSIGFLLGAVTANMIGRRIGVGPTIIVAAIIFAPSPILVAIAPAEAVLPFAAAAIFLGSFGGAVYNINQVSFRQAITPASMQGRMNATMRFIVWGTIPLGSIVGGFLGSAIGLHETIWIGAIGGTFSFIPLFFSPLLSLHEMPKPIDEPTAEGAAEQLIEAESGDLEIGPMQSPTIRPEAD